MKRNIFRSALAAILFFPAGSLHAQLRLPAVIGDHMVLQQKSGAKLWGWCNPSEKIRVTTSWDTSSYATTGTPGAKWSMNIKTPAAGGPYTITVTGGDTIVLNDVMIGEVWVCSGQSNMEMNVNWGLPYADEVSKATNRNIRFFQVPKTTASTPQEDLRASWKPCSPEEMKRFSAVGYFFGKQLQEQLNVPVGLIDASWGGTPAEVWTPKDSIAADTVLNTAAARLKASEGWPIEPGQTYNGMINPLTDYAIAGSIWYQGEANTVNWNSYRHLLTTMIGSWRHAWQKEFPFYLVQIAPYAGYGNENTAALLRDAQTTIQTYPHTGMVVVSDLVDNINDIHPKMKKEVGLRLANYALAETYGKTGVAYKSPSYKGMKIERNRIRLSFDNAENGLWTKGGAPTEFYIAGEDGHFVPADAKVDGSTVIVSSKRVKDPVAVRFGFSNAAMPNLFSKEGLPVNLFRTDNWTIDSAQARN